MFLTILTPTYNRMNTLNRLKESLEKQSLKNFEWLIIDDGSNDGTKEFIDSIKLDSTISIKYVYKNNGGKHTALNEGIKLIQTPLTFIVDSDDYLTIDAVELIYYKWEFYKDQSEIGSIWFLQSDFNGRIIGNKFLEDEFVSTYTEVMINSGIKGDKKAIYRTSLRKDFPFPWYEGEKFIGEGIIHKQIGDISKAVFINKAIYKCEYLLDGLSKNGVTMRVKYPLGGMANSKAFLTKNVCFKMRCKKMILYGAYGLIAKIKYREIISSSGYPVLAQMCLPLSYMLEKYWEYKGYVNKFKT